MRNLSYVIALTMGAAFGCGEPSSPATDDGLSASSGDPSSGGPSDGPEGPGVSPNGPQNAGGGPGVGPSNTNGSGGNPPVGPVGPVGPGEPDPVGQGGDGGATVVPPGPDSGGATSPGDVVQDGEFPPAPMKLDGDPIYTRFMRLTNEQWERAVQDILELAEPPNQARFFQTPVSGSTDFTNNESVLVMSNDLWAQYHRAAKDVVADFTASDGPLQSLYAGSNPREFIEFFGRRAYRRPLTPTEVDRFEEVFETGAEMSGSASPFTIGAGLVIEAMLQSPHFIYRTELGTDGAPLSGYEMAAKLSFLLLGTTPSDELLDTAERGELDTTQGALTVATQMLDQPEAAEALQEFHAELFEFKRFPDVVKDLAEFDPAINEELEEASLRFFDYIFREGLGVREMLTMTQGYVGPLMAQLYELPATNQMTLQELGPERAGYFSQVPFLLLYGENEHADAIHRGVHINFDVLCADVPPPPAAFTLPGVQSGQTDRERVTSATAPCGNGCHDAYINSVGFAFENFDGMGRLRTMDSNQPVNTTGSYPFADGTQSFSGAPELMSIMASTQMAHACYANHIAGYFLQREIAPADQALIEDLMETSMSQEGSVRQLVLELIAHPSFATHSGGAL